MTMFSCRTAYISKEKKIFDFMWSVLSSYFLIHMQDVSLLMTNDHREICFESDIMKENVCSVNHFFAAVVLSITVASGWEYGEYGMWCYTYNRNTDTEFWPTLQMERDRGSRGRECRTSHSITTCSLGIDPRCVVCCLCVCVCRLSDPPGPLV